MKLDLLIKNGRVIDPRNGTDDIRQIGVKHSRIVDLAEAESVEALREIDASGCLVTPGLIDFHGHINYRASDIATHPDLNSIPNCVTAVVDCGCTGVSNCRAFLDSLSRYCIKSRIFINVSPLGQSTRQFPEQLLPESWDYEQFESIFEYSKERIIGLKIRISRNIVGNLQLETLIKGIEVAERFNKKVLVHPSDPPAPVSEILGLLRRGDIYCHVYNNQGHSILENGEVCDAAWKARERGVLFDLAHGRRNFSWDVAEKAFREGFYPDLIGSDTTAMTWNYRPIYNLLNVMSKALFLGMEVAEVIRCVTDNAAVAMNLDGVLGTLTANTCADIAIFNIKEGKYPLVDANGIVKAAERIFVPLCTIVDGQILYRNAEFWG